MVLILDALRSNCVAYDSLLFDEIRFKITEQRIPGLISIPGDPEFCRPLEVRTQNA